MDKHITTLNNKLVMVRLYDDANGIVVTRSAGSTFVMFDSKRAHHKCIFEVKGDYRYVGLSQELTRDQCINVELEYFDMKSTVGKWVVLCEIK